MAFLLAIIIIILNFIRPQEWISCLKDVHLLDFATGLNILFVCLGIQVTHLKVPRVPENLLMIGVFFGILMSYIAHTYLAGTIFAFWDFLPIFIFFFLLLICIDTPGKIKITIYCLIACALVLLIHAFLQYHTGSGFGDLLPIVKKSGKIRVRAFGVFGDPNDLALCFVSVIPFVLMFIFKSKNIIVKFLNTFFCFLFLLGIWYTDSRGGIVALAVTLTVFFRNSLKGFKWVVFAVLGIMLILIFIPSRFNETLFDESSRGRVISWGYGNLMFKSSPIFGVGYKRFTAFAEERASHNSFINMYAETGLFGYFFWIGLIYISLLGLYKAMKYHYDIYKNKKSEMINYAEALFASIIGYLSTSFFLTKNYNIILFLLITLAVRLRISIGENKVFTGDILPFFYTKRILLICTGSILSFYFLTKLLMKAF